MQQAEVEVHAADVRRLLLLAHEHLGLGVVVLSEFVNGRQIYRAFAGDAASFGIVLDDGPGLGSTYCQLMIDGVIPSAVPDSDYFGVLGRVPRDKGHDEVRAYIGVPVHMPDGRLYGTLCSLSHQVEKTLNIRDERFLRLVAEFMVGSLAAQHRLQARHALISSVIGTRSLTTVLQPIVHLASGRCISMEALSRFPAACGSTEQVFRQAEEAGLSSQLELLAVQRAVRMLPLLGQEQFLAVNLSPGAAFELLPDIPPSFAVDRLILEVTEHAAVENYACIRERLRPVRERGLNLAIDDAGAGYASLRHIIELEPDIIKVDRSLIAGIEGDRGRRSAFTTFVLLALDVGALLVAEGVETSAELETVATLGADAAQGHVIARPTADIQQIHRWSSGAALLPADAQELTA